jgi:hypothetical protein
MIIPIKLLLPLTLTLMMSSLITDYINAHDMLSKGTSITIVLSWIWMFARGTIWFAVLQTSWNVGRKQGMDHAIFILDEMHGRNMRIGEENKDV